MAVPLLKPMSIVRQRDTKVIRTESFQNRARIGAPLGKLVVLASSFFAHSSRIVRIQQTAAKIVGERTDIKLIEFSTSSALKPSQHDVLWRPELYSCTSATCTHQSAKPKGFLAPLRVLVTNWRIPESDQFYRVTVRVPKGREQQLLPLFQNALAATFGLKVHWQQEERDVLVLRVPANSKPRLTSATPDEKPLFQARRGQASAKQQPLSKLSNVFLSSLRITMVRGVSWSS